MRTQDTYQKGEPRYVAVVVDPNRSTKSAIDMDAFRNFPEHMMQMAQLGRGSSVEPRQTTSNIGYIREPNRVALHHGCDKLYYSIAISLRMKESEQKMLNCLNKSTWTNSLKIEPHTTQHEKNVKALKKMATLTKNYSKWIKDEIDKTTTESTVAKAGKMDPRKHLGKETDTLLQDNVTNCLGTMVNTIVF